MNQQIEWKLIQWLFFFVIFYNFYRCHLLNTIKKILNGDSQYSDLNIFCTHWINAKIWKNFKFIIEIVKFLSEFVCKNLQKLSISKHFYRRSLKLNVGVFCIVLNVEFLKKVKKTTSSINGVGPTRGIRVEVYLRRRSL